MKRINRLITICFLLVIIIAFIVAAYVNVYSANTEDQYGDIIGLNDGWSYLNQQTSEHLTLPAQFNVQQIAISRSLPEQLPEDAVIYLATDYQLIGLSVNGEAVNAEGMIRHTAFGIDYVDKWLIIDLPSDSAGAEIVLTVQNANGKASIVLGDILLGNKRSVMAMLIRTNIGMLLLCFFMMGAAIFLLLLAAPIGYFYNNLTTGGFFYLSLFFMMAGVWIFNEGHLLKLFLHNIGGVSYFVCFFALMLMSIPLLMFVREISNHGRRLLNGVCLLWMLNFVVNIVALLLGISTLVKLLPVTHILLLLSIISIFYICCVEWFKYHNKNVAEILIGLVVIAALAIVSLFQYYTNSLGDYSLWFRFSIIVFVLLLCIGSVRRGLYLLTQSKGFADISSAIPCGISKHKLDEQLTIVYANDYYYNMFGYTEAEAKKLGFTNALYTICPDDFLLTIREIRENIASGIDSFEREIRQTKKDGTIIWVLVRYNYVSGTDEICATVFDITDRKKIDEQLRISEEEYRIAVNHSDKLIFRYDLPTKTAAMHPNAAETLGLPLIIENFPDSVVEKGVVAPESVADCLAIFESINRGEPNGSGHARLRTVGGEYAWFRLDFTVIYSDEGDPIQAVISFYDISDLREKEIAFKKWQQNYEAMPRQTINYYEYNLTEDTFDLEEGEMLPPVPAVVERTLSAIALYTAEQYIYPDDSQKFLEFYSRERLQACYNNGMCSDNMECRRLGKNGAHLWTKASVQLIPDPYSSNIKGFILLQDIDSQKSAQLLLETKSREDSLTGLLNRASFINEVNALIDSTNKEQQHALIMIDIDNFKQVNDVLGHIIGDNVLVDVSNNLKSFLRSGDLIGRLGGDEFMICLKNIPKYNVIDKRAELICNLLHNHLDMGVTISGSLGIAIYPRDGVCFDELYEKADIALYMAKKNGRNRYFFSSADQQ